MAGCVPSDLSRTKLPRVISNRIGNICGVPEHTFAASSGPVLHIFQGSFVQFLHVFQDDLVQKFTKFTIPN